MRTAAVVLAAMLLGACSSADDGQEQPATDDTGPVGFPEQTACDTFYKLLAGAQRGDKETVDQAAREIDVLALHDPVDDDGEPSRVGELIHQFADIDDPEQVNPWVEEFDAACDNVES